MQSGEQWGATTDGAGINQAVVPGFNAAQSVGLYYADATTALEGAASFLGRCNVLIPSLSPEQAREFSAKQDEIRQHLATIGKMLTGDTSGG